jgi:hypothetical protein
MNDNRRKLATLIDLVVVGAVGAAVLAAAGLAIPAVALAIGWALYYRFACESGRGQTLGKRLMKLRVVRQDGTPAEMREIAIRIVRGDDAAGTKVVATDARPAPAAPVATAIALPEPAAPALATPAPVPEAPEPAPAPPAPAPELATPSLKELAEDVAALSPFPAAPLALPEPPVQPEPVEMTVKPVDTVSAIDLVMGDEEPVEEEHLPPA